MAVRARGSTASSLAEIAGGVDDRVAGGAIAVSGFDSEPTSVDEVLPSAQPTGA